MDFLRRMFGGSDGATLANPAEPIPDLPAIDEPVVDDSRDEVDVAWRRVDSATGASEYHGMVDEAHVATITKLTSATKEPWEWQLKVTVDSDDRGTTKRLKDAKVAVANALGDWQP
jgi:hypothetical protein